MQPEISVVIPAYNAAAFIGQTIEGVLSQARAAEEIIVVDDGSTDETPRVVQSFGDCVRYIRQENSGPSRARNRGLKEARGKYVALLDADDLWVQTKLLRQIAFMERYPEIGFCFSDCVLFDDRGGEPETFFSGKVIFPTLPVEETESNGRIILRKVHEDLLFENFIVTSSVVIRAGVWPRESWFGEMIYFDETLYNGQDFDLWFRMATRLVAGVIPDVLVRKRRHAANISTRKESVLINRIRLRDKIHRMVQERKDISSRAKNRCRERLLLAYTDLARWYLVHGDSEKARGVCREGIRIRIRPGLLVIWVFSLLGVRISQWFLRAYRLRKAFGA